TRPAQRVEVRGRSALELDSDLRDLEGRRLGPSAGYDARLGLALDEERGLESGLGVVKVSPALAPDRGPLLPAQALAGQQGLEGSGEAGLAGAVATHHEHEAGTGRELERSRRSDAAESLDGDRAEERAGRGGGGSGSRHRRGGGAARELGLEALRS